MHQQSEAPQVTNIISSRVNLFGKIDQSCLLNVKTVVYRRSFAVVNGGYFRLLIFLASADTLHFHNRLSRYFATQARVCLCDQVRSWEISLVSAVRS